MPKTATGWIVHVDTAGTKLRERIGRLVDLTRKGSIRPFVIDALKEKCKREERRRDREK